MSDSEKFNSQDILNAIDMNKINQTEKKRRGRPKKTQMVSPNPKIKIPINEDDVHEEDEIILHLPISRDDIKSLGLSSISIEESTKNSSDSEEEESSDKEVKNNDPNYKQLGLIIKKLKDENDELKKFLTEITPMYFTEVKIYPVDLKLFDMENNCLIPKKTNICCWWCTYQFDWLPTYLPEKFSDNKFYVSGCFCSFNCAAAYNLSLIDDSKKWERYSLLKQLYYMINKDKITNITEININIAPPHTLLDKFGGHMTITEYRKNSKILGREYHKLMPPFVPITMGFEETTNSKLSKNVNINNIISTKNDNVLVKRNNPVKIASKNIDHYIE